MELENEMDNLVKMTTPLDVRKTVSDNLISCANQIIDGIDGKLKVSTKLVSHHYPDKYSWKYKKLNSEQIHRVLNYVVDMYNKRGFNAKFVKGYEYYYNSKLYFYYIEIDAGAGTGTSIL